MIALLRTVQAPPAPSWGTYHAGYAIVAVIYVGYALSLWARARRFRRAIESAESPRRG